MARVIETNFKPSYYMVDTWKKDNMNNNSGFYKKFNNKEESQEICDINNIDEFGFYNNRFIVKNKLN